MQTQTWPLGSSCKQMKQGRIQRTLFNSGLAWFDNFQICGHVRRGLLIILLSHVLPM